MLINNLINPNIVNLTNLISDNTDLILTLFSEVALILIPTFLYAKKGGGKILQALQAAAAASTTGKAGVDVYEYYKQKVEEYNAKPGNDSNNPQVDNKPSGSDNNSNKPTPTDGGNSGIKDASSK
uniref:Uncharacterized protein n=1 Tax=Pleurotus pulmonarius TaxID=28995 RepID=A0A4D5XWT5_PLEPU|nr:hypothetical protein [Pleurotus pulmonarius]